MSDLMFDVMRTIGGGLSAQRRKMEAIASNIANAETTRGESGAPYRRKDVVMSEKASERSFEIPREAPQIGLDVTAPNHIRSGAIAATKRMTAEETTVEAEVVEAAPDDVKVVYDPRHPDADANGYVAYPNVNPVEEMVDMITASRAYQANIASMEAFKSIVDKALEL